MKVYISMSKISGALSDTYLLLFATAFFEYFTFYSSVKGGATPPNPSVPSNETFQYVCIREFTN